MHEGLWAAIIYALSARPSPIAMHNPKLDNDRIETRLVNIWMNYQQCLHVAWASISENIFLKCPSRTGVIEFRLCQIYFCKSLTPARMNMRRKTRQATPISRRTRSQSTLIHFIFKKCLLHSLLLPCAREKHRAVGSHRLVSTPCRWDPQTPRISHIQSLHPSFISDRLTLHCSFTGLEGSADNYT